MSDELMELPEGWTWSQLSEVVSPDHPLCYGVVQPGEETKQGAYLIRVCDLDDGTVQLENLRKISQEIDQQYKRSKVYGGELLVSLVGTIGRVAIVPNEIKEANIARAIARVHPVDDVSACWLAYWLRTDDMQDWLNREAREVARKTLNLNTLETTRIPIAPLNEQRRIVAKIEELRERSQKAREALTAIPELCDKFRQSVLAAAFRGDLTADWREQNPDVEPASVLLERIRRDRRQRWEESELSKILVNRKAHTDEKWKLKYKEPTRLHDSELPELPNGWIWASVEEFADVGTGATPLRSGLKYYENGSIPWVTSGALNSLFITQAEEHITPVAIQETNAKVFPIHTLLIAMYGEGKTRGKVSELLIEAATNQACAALVMNGFSSNIRPIVKLFFQKNYTDIRRLASGGVQPNLNLSMIKNTAVPLPPLQEQAEIIQVIDRCMAIVDNIERQYQASENKLDYFNRSILAKAFRGELVEQDPTDEPAAVLLERIRAEREKLNSSPKKQKVGRKSKS